MANLHLYVGLPGSGKSTKAKEHALVTGAIHLSSDEIGKELFGEYVANGEEVFKELYNRADQALKQGKDVIVDATNLVLKRRKVIIEQFRKKADKLIAHYFSTPLDVCLDRNNERERVVPERVIKEMYKTATVPTQEEGWYEVFIHHSSGALSDEFRIDLEKVISKEQNYYDLMGCELFQYEPFRQIYELAQDNPHHSLSVSRHEYYVWEYVLKNYSGSGKLEMLWTALFHDTGKYFTKTFKKLEDGSISRYANFIGHENVSAQLACYYLKLLGYDDSFVLNVVFLVQNHMRLLSIGDSEKGKKKMLDFVGEDAFQMLEFFRSADTSAK